MDTDGDEEIFDTHRQRIMFSHYKFEPMSKPTNFPKWGYKMLLKYLELNYINHRHCKWIETLRKKIDIKGTNLNRYTLMNLLHENN
jgi:hypothetical protein